MNRSLGRPCVVERAIDAASRREERVRVLEIGCGEGRVLLELRKLYPGVELHGINKNRWSAMRGSASLRQTALFYGIFTRRELATLELPSVHFYDATRLHFDDGYFDLVISQVSIHYVHRKDLLLQEVWRVLKPGGRALLHVDTCPHPRPDFFYAPTPRFVIYDGPRRTTLAALMRPLRARGFSIGVRTERNGSMDGTVVSMLKTRTEPLSLGLVYDELSSFPTEVLDPNRRCPAAFHGFRSVYHLGLRQRS